MLNLVVKDAVSSVSYAASHMETMGIRIRRLRDAKGFTQVELAELCGVTKSAVSQWEDDTTADIKLKPFMRLCEVLGTDARYLVWGPDRVDPEQSAPTRHHPR